MSWAYDTGAAGDLVGSLVELGGHGGLATGGLTLAMLSEHKKMRKLLTRAAGWVSLPPR